MSLIEKPSAISFITSEDFRLAVGARPRYLPSRFAAAIPSRCRSNIISRSNAAIEPNRLHPQIIVLIMGLFAVGIILALAAGISGFFTMAARADAHAQEIYALINSAWAYVAQIELEESEPSERAFWQENLQKVQDKEREHNTNAIPLFKKFWRRRNIGIGSIFSSFICFIAAAVIAALEVL